MSKLEPHVLEPKADDDVEQFLQAVDDEPDVAPAFASEPNHNPAEESQDEIKQGFIRLVDYLKKQKGRNWQSRRSLAIRAYELQKAQFDTNNPEHLHQSVNYAA